MARFPMDDSPELDEILDQALDLPANERAPFLDKACQGRAELRERIDHILASDAREDLLDRPIGDVAVGLLADLGEPAVDSQVVGRHIGPYHISRELGRGGMGAVYLAERDDADFQHRVAIKLVRSTSSPQHLLDRFVVERQILAGLEHPHVARLYDGGLTDDSEPYFVMEYIDGQPIDAYADERQLTIDQRLELFDQVCDAVQYAHRNLVVHRDLKPSNILVTKDGEVKLLDFGVAKLLADEDPGPSPLTQPGLAVLTPEYASPEQIAGQSVSTASDVYSLGVLLYELLTGTRPFQFETRSPVEIARTVLEKEPTRPSALFDGDGKADAANRRGTTNVRLRRRLDGDLDTIVLMALRKEPERRYDSAAQLREDLRRHRERLPVTARPNTFGYRAGKLLARHRAAASLVALVVLSMIGGLAATAWQARKAAREARTAQSVTEFLVGLFEASDPNASPGVELSARDLLDVGAERLAKGELTTEPGTQAELFSVIGNLYVALGLYDEAQPLLEQALAIKTRLYGETDGKVLRSLTDLVDVQYSTGDYEAAERAARRVLEERRRTLPDDSSDIADALINLGAVVSSQGRYDEAEPLYHEALAIDRAQGSEDRIAQDLNNLGVFLASAGKYEESRAAHEEALELRIATHGPKHTDVATNMNNLGFTLIRLGEYEESEEILRAAVDLRVELLGENHPHTAISLNNLADVMTQRGDLEGARAVHLRALEVRRATFGEEHPETAASLNNLGIVSYYQLDYAQAEEYFRQALRAFRSQLGEDHPHIMTGINNLGAVLREQGKLDDAEQLFRKNLARRREVLGDEHPAVNEGRSNLGWLLIRRGRFDEARSSFESAVDADLELLGNEHPTTASDLLGLGRSMLGLDLAGEAEEPLTQSARIRTIKFGEDDARTASSATSLGICLSALSRHEEAIPLLEKYVPIVQQSYGAEDPIAIEGQDALAASRAAVR